MAYQEEIAGARRRALQRAVADNYGGAATLGDLLHLIGEDLCDLVDTPQAGHVRLGDLIGRDGEGPHVYDLLRSFGLDLESPVESARALRLPLGQLLSTWL